MSTRWNRCGRANREIAIDRLLSRLDRSGPMLVNRLDYNHSFNGAFYGVGAQLMENGAYDPRDVDMLKNLLLVRREHHGDGVVALGCG